MHFRHFGINKFNLHNVNDSIRRRWVHFPFQSLHRRHCVCCARSEIVLKRPCVFALIPPSLSPRADGMPSFLSRILKREKKEHIWNNELPVQKLGARCSMLLWNGMYCRSRSLFNWTTVDGGGSTKRQWRENHLHHPRLPIIHVCVWVWQWKNGGSIRAKDEARRQRADKFHMNCYRTPAFIVSALRVIRYL